MGREKSEERKVRTWPLRSGATISSNIEGFELLSGERLRAAAIDAGLIPQAASPDEAA
jgi:hypothetical protein